MKTEWRALIFGLFLCISACAPEQAANPPAAAVPPSEFQLPVKWTDTLTPSITPTEIPKPTSTPEETPSPGPEIAEAVLQAKNLMKSARYEDAIEIWDQILETDPQYADGYYQRATCYTELFSGESYLDRYLRNANQALRDIDTAILLRGDIGDYYWIRATVYEYLSFVMDYYVDRAYMKNIVMENRQKAIELDPDIVEYPERGNILLLILTDRCEEALEQIEPFLAELPEGAYSSGGLLRIKSQALGCLGRLPEAIETVDAAMFNHADLPTKKHLKSIYLFQSGEYEESFALIDGLIRASPVRDGERYYLRAALYYELGNPELALQDLEIGKMYTWLHFGLLQYVEGLFALDAGDQDEAIRLLQYSEATLDPTDNPVRWKIRQMIEDLGAEPLAPTLSVDYPVTPIPLAPTPTVDYTVTPIP